MIVTKPNSATLLFLLSCRFNTALLETEREKERERERERERFDHQSKALDKKNKISEKVRGIFKAKPFLMFILIL